MILIIAEKPSVAKKIANALGKAKKKKIYDVPYYEVDYNGKKIVVASAVGHLFTLVEKNKSFSYPTFEIKWAPAYIEKGKSYVKNYIRALKELSKHADEIYIATDYDIEGELIGYHALKFCCGRDKGKRMKFSSLTKREIIKAFENPISIDYGLVDAGESRHIVDWYFGINLSRALMHAVKALNDWKILSIGRVQGPTLYFLAEREKEIKEFKPKPYWILEAYLKNLKAIHEKEKFWDEEEAKKIYKKVKDAKYGEVVKVERRVSKIKPPVPFDLGTLQREAYNYFKFSPKKTQEIAQSLYEKGLCLHPDTLILLPDGIKKIKELKEEGEVLCLDHNLKLTRSRYKLLKRTVREKLIKITLNDGTELITTREHPILVYRDKLLFVPSERLKEKEQIITLGHQNKELSLDNYLINEDLKRISEGDVYISKIKKIEEIEYEGEVYDLVVDKFHNFIANGIVVHNCSYPRTSSQKLPKDWNYLENILKTLKNSEYWKFAERIIEEKRKPIEGKKDDPAHPAIHVVDYPKNKEELSKEELKVYDLIARRTLSAFWDEMEREYINAKISINDELFKASGSKTVKEGWHVIYHFPTFEELNLNLKEGEKVKVEKIKLVKKETKPPKRYTLSSIIKELEKRNLGTKATRAEIVDKLIKRGYIKVGKNGSLEVTDLGASIVEVFKRFCPEIVDEKLTRELEEKLENIQMKKINKDLVLEEAKKRLIEVLKKFKEKEVEIGKNLTNKEVVGTCPRCGSPLVVKEGKYGKFIGCTNFPKCKFTKSLE
ncbi:DNA topoisomerase I [Methanocaldococcus infernus]